MYLRYMCLTPSNANIEPGKSLKADCHNVNAQSWMKGQSYELILNSWILSGWYLLL